MTPADVRKIIKAASRGPWRADKSSGELFDGGGRLLGGVEGAPDAELIAMLRSLGPLLLTLWEATRRKARRQSLGVEITDALERLKAYSGVVVLKAPTKRRGQRAS